MRVSESLTQERNRARKEVERLKETLASIESGHGAIIKELAEARAAASADWEKQRAQLEEAIKSKDTDLGVANDNCTKLKDQAQRLNEENTMLKQQTSANEIKIAEAERAQYVWRSMPTVKPV